MIIKFFFSGFFLVLFISMNVISVTAQTGNVGIDVNAPAEKLDVNGNIQLSGEIKINGAGGTAGQVLTSNGNGTMAWASQMSGGPATAGFGNWGDCATNQNIGDYFPVADNEGKANDRFGEVSAIDGYFAVISSPGDDVGSNVDQGSLSVYQFDGTQWNFVQKLVDPAGEANDYLGVSVTISGNTIVAGVPEDDVASNVNQGTAVIFRYDGASWNYFQKIGQTPGFPGDKFGTSVTLINEYVICGAPYFDTNASNNKGAVVIFKDDGVQYNQWQAITDVNLNNSAHFGSAVAINGDLELMIGVPWQNLTYNTQGAVHVYLFDGWIWNYGQTLSDPAGANGDTMGDFLACKNGIVIASQIGNQNDKGSAAIFSKNNSVYEFSQKITDPNGVGLDRFGQSVAITHEYALVGAANANVSKGKALLFVKVGSIWKVMQAISEPNALQNTYFGMSVALDSNTNRFLIGSNQVAGKGMAFFGKIN